MSAPNPVTVTVDAGPIADAVLRRVVGAVAAQSRLPIDRLRDAALVIDTILGTLASDEISALFTSHEQEIQIAVGPVSADEAARLLRPTEFPESGAILHGLGDRVWVDDARVCVVVGRSSAG